MWALSKIGIGGYPFDPSFAWFYYCCFIKLSRKYQSIFRRLLCGVWSKEDSLVAVPVFRTLIIFLKREKGPGSSSLGLRWIRPQPCSVAWIGLTIAKSMDSLLWRGGSQGNGSPKCHVVCFLSAWTWPTRLLNCSVKYFLVLVLMRFWGKENWFSFQWVSFYCLETTFCEITEISS